jgi:hypothetical protein
MARTLTLSIEPALFARFPSLRLGAFVATHLERVSLSIRQHEIQDLLRPRAIRRDIGAAGLVGRLISTVQLVTISRAIAVRHLVPLRGYDLDALPAASITIRAACPRSDWFVPLGARPTDMPLSEEDVVHAAGTTVLSWAFTARESRQTCLCERTRRAAFVAQAITSAQTRASAAALRDLRGLLASHGADVTDVVVVDAHAPGAELPCDEPAPQW